MKKNKFVPIVFAIFMVIIMTYIFILVKDKYNVIKKENDNINPVKQNTEKTNTKKESSAESKEKDETSKESTVNIPKEEIKENQSEKINNVMVDMELIGDSEVRIKVGEQFKDPGIKATDENGKDVTKNVVIQNDVDTSKKGTYLISYSIGKSIVIRTVIVE